MSRQNTKTKQKQRKVWDDDCDDGNDGDDDDDGDDDGDDDDDNDDNCRHERLIV